MRNLHSVKKEVLRGAVRENVDHIEGRLPKGIRPATHRLRIFFRVLALVVVPSAIFVSINAISGRPPQPEVVVVGTSGAAPTKAPLPDSLPAPHRIDPSVFRLDVTRIVLDPGHGGSDPGAKTASGLFEKEVTLDVARRVKPLLEQAAFKVSLTRESDETRSLKERALFANKDRADLFVSIHVNSMGSPQNRGVETYFMGATTDPNANRLAGEENRGSGYSMADFRSLLEGIYVDVRQNESKKLAESVQSRLVSSLKTFRPGVPDRGVKSAPFVVLIATEMPGILAEVSCVSNPDEARALHDPAYRDAIARALADGLLGYARSRGGKAG
ncbi:MAG TPA: N-acetylmuramoyl-L-alanine amidase [Thermoanaerobaculia bacterium]|nr:N-acetylmuramoyl-L-alanine amidase [Thermoanaerobaculia bacterium]